MSGPFDHGRKALPVIWHRFRDLEEALTAARFDEDSATLTLPLPVLVPVSEVMALRFRIGGGQLREGTGRTQVVGGSLVIRFEGHEAGIVKDAIEKLTHPKRPRAFVRFRCWLPVTLELGGQEIQATACDIAVGGARLTALPDPLPAGTELGVKFSGQPKALKARVAWSLAEPVGGAAGLIFDQDPATLPMVRRLVSDASKGASDLH